MNPDHLAAHHLLVRAAGLVKIDPGAAALLARQALALIEPRTTILGILSAATEPVTTKEIAEDLNVSPRVALARLSACPAARRIGVGFGTCWSLRRVAA